MLQLQFCFLTIYTIQDRDELELQKDLGTLEKIYPLIVTFVDNLTIVDLGSE